MSALGALLAVHRRVHFPLSMLWRNLRHGQQRWRTLFYTLLVLGTAGPFLYGYAQLIRLAFNVLRPIGQESALVALGVISGQIAVLVLGLMHVISAFYFSNDLERLIPLPLRPHQVIVSRLLVVLASECVFLAPLSLPVLVGYGILSGEGPAYWTLLPVVFLLAPVIPLAAAALIAMGLMRIVNLSRRKDALMIWGTLLVIALQLWFQTRSGPEGEGSAMLMRLVSDEDGLLRVIGRRFPPAVWASRALTQGFTWPGAANLLGLAAASAAAFAVVVAVAERLFYQGAIGLNEIAARRRLLSRAQIERSVGGGYRPVRAIFLRELRIMNRTPVFLLNGMLSGLFIPAALLVAARTSEQGGISTLLRQAGSGAAIVQVLALALFFTVSGCLSGTASTTLSREGRRFWISQVIPVPWRAQVTAKFLHTSFVTLVGFLAASLVAVVALRAPAGPVLAAFLLAAVVGTALNLTGFFVDLARPVLRWTNPQAAIKQNLNVVIALLANLGLLAIAGLGASRLLRAGLSGTTVYLILLGTFLALGALAWNRLQRFAERRYPAIEG